MDRNKETDACVAAQLVDGRLDLGRDGAAVAAVGHIGRSGRPAPKGGHLGAVPCIGLPCHCHHVDSVTFLHIAASCKRHTGYVSTGTYTVNKVRKEGQTEWAAGNVLHDVGRKGPDLWHC